MRILVGLLAWLAMIAPAGADLLMGNGRFEHGEAPVGWRLPPREVFSVDRAIFAEGRRSLRFANTSPEHRGPWTISHDTLLPPGRAVRVQGHIRPSGFRGSVQAWLLARHPFTSDLQPIGWAVLAPETEGTTSGWQPFAFAAGPSHYGGMGALRLIFHGMGQAWIDGVEILPMVSQPGSPFWRTPPAAELPDRASLLADGGFEGLSSPWQRFYNVRRAQGIVCAFDRSEVYRGNISALVANRSPFFWDPAGWRQEITGLPAGSMLSLTGHIRTQDVQGSAYLRLECWGRPPGGAERPSNEEELLASSESPKRSGITPWSPTTVRIQVPEGATRVVVSCILAGRGSAWFDELELRWRRSDGALGLGEARLLFPTPSLRY